MKKHDWMLLGYIGTVLGIIFLVGGLFCYFYYETTWILVVYPFQKYAVSLLISGIILLVVGQGFLWRAKQETDTVQSV